MKRPTTSVADDLIVEPIEEAVKLYDELLKELDKFMETRIYEPGKSRALGLTMFTVDSSFQNILDGPEFRYFASLANRPGPDSLKVFNKIISKITQQSINTMNAMLPHIVCKISNAPKTRVTATSKMVDAGPAELFDEICPRLKLGNDIHLTFKRAGKATLAGLQRLKEQNDMWLKIWENGLVQYEPKTVKASFDQVRNAMMNLERTMTACLRIIHTHQMKQGW